MASYYLDIGDIGVSGNGLRFAPLYDLRLYLPATSGFALRLRDLFKFSYRIRPRSPLIKKFRVLGAFVEQSGPKW
jgi:hypothetical protein